MQMFYLFIIITIKAENTQYIPKEKSSRKSPIKYVILSFSSSHMKLKQCTLSVLLKASYN